MEDEIQITKVQGLELILKSINCEKYKSKFENHGIDEHSLVHLTADDLRYMDIDDKDFCTILAAVNILNKTLDHRQIRLSNDEVLKLQSNICGQLGSIALVLNHMHSIIASEKNNLNDLLIDDYISAIDAALMLKPYLEAEEKNIENTMKNVFKIKTRSKTIMMTTTATVGVIVAFGLTYKHLNYSFNYMSILPNLISQKLSW